MQGRLGWYAARIHVPPGAGVTGRHTKGGHWTLGPPLGQTAAACFYPLVMDTRPVPR